LTEQYTRTMKKILLLCQILLLALFGFAQKNNKDQRYKALSGCYGKSTEGICLFDDGTFLLYGYATAIFGNYGFEKDYMLFYPDKSELFEVYAHQNKSIGASAKIDFKGFDRALDTFVQLGADSIKTVFNKDANCFDAPFVLTRKNKVSSITLSNKNASWTYQIDKNVNDLTLIYNAPGRYSEHFSGMISIDENEKLLKLSASFGEKGFKKQKTDESKGQSRDIMQLKNEYDLSKKNTGDFVFANKHYHPFPAPAAAEYLYDQASNQYISKKEKETEAYYRQNQYNDPRYLRKYVKLSPKIKGDFSGLKDSISSSSIFYTVCGEGAEKSYHYKGYQKYKEDDRPAPVPTTMPPVPIPAIKKTNDK
jgi:hypothetical protein